MKVGPDIAPVAALLGDPARANMLTALLAGQALTAGELAREAGVTSQTASSHLARLQAGGLVVRRRQGRHGYFALAGEDVARVLEGLMGLAERAGHLRARPGPREPALRRARVCYDHLAGDLGVAMLEGLTSRGFLDGTLVPTADGEALMDALGLDLAALRAGRRPLARACLDWSVRRSHLAGALGAALLRRLYELGWARRVDGSRVVAFTPDGERKFAEVFGLSERTTAADRR
ncbi:MAG: ArsR/SmtB family transcription factor [Pseudomonadota bacterium]